MLKVDLHIHTVHSGHAFGTIYEIAKEAARKNMSIIGISDHGPALPGVTTFFSHFICDRAPKELNGVRVLWGCEANIVDHSGRLDVEPVALKTLDYVIAGLHPHCGFEDRGEKENTEAFIRAIKNNDKIRIISHPFESYLPFDSERVIEAAFENGVMPELNLSSLNRGGDKIGKHRRLVDMARERRAKLIVNTDAHFLHEVGDDAALMRYWEEIGFAEDLLINNYVDELLQVLKPVSFCQ